MNSLFKKVAGLLPDLEARGTVYLLALVDREEVELWDLVVSSAWSDDDWAGAVRTIVELLKPRLSPEEITTISRIGILSSSDPRVQNMPIRVDGTTLGDYYVIERPYFRSDERRTIIFKALPAAGVSEELLVKSSV